MFYIDRETVFGRLPKSLGNHIIPRQYLRDIARTPPYNQGQARASKLDPFKTYLQDRIEAAKQRWIPGIFLCREI